MIGSFDLLIHFTHLQDLQAGQLLAQNCFPWGRQLSCHSLPGWYTLPGKPHGFHAPRIKVARELGRRPRLEMTNRTSSRGASREMATALRAPAALCRLSLPSLNQRATSGGLRSKVRSSSMGFQLVQPQQLQMVQIVGCINYLGVQLKLLTRLNILYIYRHLQIVMSRTIVSMEF